MEVQSYSTHFKNSMKLFQQMHKNRKEFSLANNLYKNQKNIPRTELSVEWSHRWYNDIVKARLWKKNVICIIIKIKIKNRENLESHKNMIKR